MADSSGASLSPALGQAGGASARAPAKQKRQSREKAGHGRQGVSWRSTFIELGDDDAERQSSLSPRPSSEPCSEASSLRSTFFDADRTQTAALSKHMEEAWASNDRKTMRKFLSADPKGDSQDEAYEEGADDRAVLHGADARSSAQAPVNGSAANGQTGPSMDATGNGLSEGSSAGSVSERGARIPGTRSHGLARAPKKQSLGDATSKESREQLSWKATFLELRDDEHQGLISPRPSSEPCSEPSASRNEVFDADRLSTAALSKHMEEAWAANSRETMRTSLEKRRLSAAAAAIDSIPEQLSSVVHNKAQSLAESVKTDLSLVQKAIRSSGGDDDAVDVAIDQLGKIPDIIRNVFASKMMEANGAIRMKLSAVMQRIKSITPESQDMVTQMWTIPEELEKITSEAIDQAVQDSKREATKQCDHVLRTLPQAAAVSRQALEDTAVRITEAISEMFFETMRALRRTTSANVKHAVAHVEEPGDVPVTNCMIADVLLRAKADALPQAGGVSRPPSSRSAATTAETGGRVVGRFCLRDVEAREGA